jgi:hypothetical protein
VKDLYHSALGEAPTGSGLDSFATVNGTAFVHDVMSADYLPDAYRDCDVLYADPPWQRGYKTFTERCCIEPAATYDAFMFHVADLIERAEVPAVMVAGKQAAKYFDGWLPIPTRLQRFDALAYYSPGIAPIQAYTANGILEGLARKFDCVGDFFAGYGASARAFTMAGKRFVASDCNPQCIATLQKALPPFRG